MAKFGSALRKSSESSDGEAFVLPAGPDSILLQQLETTNTGVTATILTFSKGWGCQENRILYTCMIHTAEHLVKEYIILASPNQNPR